MAVFGAFFLATTFLTVFLDAVFLAGILLIKLLFN